MQALRIRQRLWRSLPVITITLVLALLWKVLLFSDQPMAKERREQKFPQFSLVDVHDKKTITNATLLGKTHVVHVWASWCGACIKELPLFIHLQKKSPVSMVGVLYQDDTKKAVGILKQKGDPFNYLLNDKAGKLGRSLAILGTPETFIIDPEGVIRFHESGTLDQETINNQIIPLLEKIDNEFATR